MRFVWPAQRYDRLTRRAAALSVAITTVIAAALSLPIVTIYRAATGDASARPEVTREAVTFVQPSRQAHPVSTSRARSEVRSTRRSKRDEQLLNSDTGSAAPVRGESVVNAGPTESARAPGAKPESRSVGPVAQPVGIQRPPVVGAPPPPWGWLPLTQAERDSIAREQDRRLAEAREQHRPVAIPLGGASLPLPFLSRGPSREERARDSTIHADNLARLARLAERARAKRDSLNAASKVACKTNERQHSC